jgi:hypothetical protein
MGSLVEDMVNFQELDKSLNFWRLYGLILLFGFPADGAR